MDEELELFDDVRIISNKSHEVDVGTLGTIMEIFVDDGETIYVVEYPLKEEGQYSFDCFVRNELEFIKHYKSSNNDILE